MAHPQSSPRGLFAKAEIALGKLTMRQSAAIPTGDGAERKIALVLDSTGRAAICVNTTGTTWKYANLTSVFPT